MRAFRSLLLPLKAVILNLISLGAAYGIIVFFVLSSSPGVDIKQFGIGLAAGIIFDATVIRALLVPAIMRLMGDWNWWLPHRLARLLRAAPTAPPALEPGS